MPAKPETAEAPFLRGEVVICDLRHLTVRPGEKVRVVECVASDDCESGWLVVATKRLRGRIAKSPLIAIQDVDSGWFRKVKGRKRNEEL
jgi:hypothetical protein